MTDSSIRRLNKIAIIFLMALWSQPVLASSVEIVRWSTQCDNVKLRVKAVDDSNVPIQGLKAKDFQFKTTNAQGQQITLKPSQINFIPSQQSQPDPAYLVMLLDMSGSMKNQDLAGKKKQEEAVKAVREVIRDIRAEKMPVQIALIPFGEAGKYCKQGFKVDADEISRRLVKVTDNQLDEQLNTLAAIEVCAATIIYEPLAETVKFLGESNFPSPTKDMMGQPLPPRFAVILLSDGYDVSRSNEKERFQNLIEVLHQYPQVTVHAMGYGEKLRQLRDRSNCSLSDSQLTVDNISAVCRLPGKDINEFIVDESRLNEIAQATGGIYRLPGKCSGSCRNLKDIFNHITRI
ncbi:MAG: vWA domain-containing protein [Microcoleus sp.]